MSTSSRPDRADPTRTTLLLGGRIYPATPTTGPATAMAVTGDTVTWVGPDEPARAAYGNADEVVQLDGALVTPAFVDAHVHATSAGLLRTGLDLTGCASAADCLDAVRRHAAGGHGVLWGHGWDETRWPHRRVPTRDELDAAAGGAPVYLSRVDVHSALVTTALIRRADATPADDGWSERGPLTRQAHHLVRRAALDSISVTQRRAAQATFLRAAAAAGVVSVHECAGPDISSQDDLADLIALSTSDTRPEVVGYWGELGAFELARQLGVRGLAGDLFVDGALGSHTAALHEPYADDPATTGVHYLDVDDITDHVVACTRAGLQAGFHVIGDAAVSAAVDGFAKAAETVGRDALAAARHRLEHLEMIDAGQAERLANWGVVASVQPLFDANWGGRDRMYATRLGARRASALNPFATLAAAGMPLAFGSDAPVTPISPWHAVRAAVHHRTDGFGVDPRAAFTAHTIGGWRARGVDDALTGTLAPGARAHYAIWDAPESDGNGLPPLESVADLPRCRRTVRGGHVIYRREEGT